MWVRVGVGVGVCGCMYVYILLCGGHVWPRKASQGLRNWVRALEAVAALLLEQAIPCLQRPAGKRTALVLVGETAVGFYLGNR